MPIAHIAAFAASHDQGGNPAGVVICDALPPDDDMQAIAARIGYSETVFSCPRQGAWRTRYFSPITEVPFCGHATIALGAALADKHGSGTFQLRLNAADITVEGTRTDGEMTATLMSPPPSQRGPSAAFLRSAMALFDLTEADLDPTIPPMIASAGANHLVLALKSRARLAAMHYDLEAGKQIMAAEDLITIMLVHAATPQKFHVRNAFASGGVLEDPATGAAAAAFGGYLSAMTWHNLPHIDIVQGEDMGMTSALRVALTEIPGQPLRVSGTARYMTAAEIARHSTP